MKIIDNIYNQPERLQKIVSTEAVIANDLIKLVKNKKVKKVYFTGSGTSYHASTLISMYFNKFTKLDTEAIIPDNFTNYLHPSPYFKPEETLLVGISQSGTSTTTLEAIRKAKELNFGTVAISEETNSKIAQEADLVIYLNTGDEVIPVETRGYTSTVMLGLILALRIGLSQDVITGEEYQKVITQTKDELTKLPTTLKETEKFYQENKNELVTMRKGAIAGYGYNYATALEAYLKMYETFHAPLSVHEFGELLHGYEMAFDSNQYIYLIISNGPEKALANKCLDFLKQITKHLFVITDQDIKFIPEAKVLKVPSLDIDELSPLNLIIPFQVIASRNCEAIGYDTSKYPLTIESFAHFDID